MTKAFELIFNTDFPTDTEHFLHKWDQIRVPFNAQPENSKHYVIEPNAPGFAFDMKHFTDDEFEELQGRPDRQNPGGTFRTGKKWQQFFERARPDVVPEMFQTPSHKKKPAYQAPDSVGSTGTMDTLSRWIGPATPSKNVPSSPGYAPSSPGYAMSSPGGYASSVPISSPLATVEESRDLMGDIDSDSSSAGRTISDLDIFDAGQPDTSSHNISFGGESVLLPVSDDDTIAFDFIDLEDHDVAIVPEGYVVPLPDAPMTPQEAEAWEQWKKRQHNAPIRKIIQQNREREFYAYNEMAVPGQTKIYPKYKRYAILQLDKRDALEKHKKCVNYRC